MKVRWPEVALPKVENSFKNGIRQRRLFENIILRKM